MPSTDNHQVNPFSSPYATQISRITCYTMLSTTFKCQDAQHTLSVSQVHTSTLVLVTLPLARGRTRATSLTLHPPHCRSTGPAAHNGNFQPTCGETPFLSSHSHSSLMDSMKSHDDPPGPTGGPTGDLQGPDRPCSALCGRVCCSERSAPDWVTALRRLFSRYDDTRRPNVTIHVSHMTQPEEGRF